MHRFTPRGVPDRSFGHGGFILPRPRSAGALIGLPSGGFLFGNHIYGRHGRLIGIAPIPTGALRAKDAAGWPIFVQTAGKSLIATRLIGRRAVQIVDVRVGALDLPDRDVAAVAVREFRGGSLVLAASTYCFVGPCAGREAIITVTVRGNRAKLRTGVLQTGRDFEQQEEGGIAIDGHRRVLVAVQELPLRHQTPELNVVRYTRSLRVDHEFGDGGTRRFIIRARSRRTAACRPGCACDPVVAGG